MPFGFVAFHYPRADQFDHFVDRTRLVRRTLLDQPGCRAVEIWATPDRDAVVTKATFEAGLPAGPRRHQLAGRRGRLRRP